MRNEQRQVRAGTVRLITGGVAVALFCLLAFGVRLIAGGGGARRQRQIQRVMLMKPPPPPPEVEKVPPPPEVEKSEMVEPHDRPVEEKQVNAAPPPGEQLGLDADGSGGADAFGLAARKGGKGLIGGDSASPYAWYQQLYVEEIQKRVNKLMQQRGGVQEGDFFAVVRVVVDDRGEAVNTRLLKSSGNAALDAVVKAALQAVVVEEPPPIGMPRAMKFKVSSTG